MTNIPNFLVIAHRGLLKGPSKNLENNPENIISNIKNYPNLFNEIDINILKDGIYIGHDEPLYKIDLKFIIDNKRSLAAEILVNNNAIANLIREAKSSQVYSQLQIGTKFGMQTLEQNLSNLVKRGVITNEEAVYKCNRPSVLKGLLEELNPTAKE